MYPTSKVNNDTINRGIVQCNLSTSLSFDHRKSVMVTVYLLVRFAILSDTLTWFHHCYAFFKRASLHHILYACKWWSCRHNLFAFCWTVQFMHTIGNLCYRLQVKNERMNLMSFLHSWLSLDRIYDRQWIQELHVSYQITRVKCVSVRASR